MIKDAAVEFCLCNFNEKECIFTEKEKWDSSFTPAENKEEEDEEKRKEKERKSKITYFRMIKKTAVAYKYNKNCEEKEAANSVF